MDFGIYALHFTIQAPLISILHNPQSVLYCAWSMVQSYTISGPADAGHSITQDRFACGTRPSPVRLTPSEPWWFISAFAYKGFGGRF